MGAKATGFRGNRRATSVAARAVWLPACGSALAAPMGGCMVQRCRVVCLSFLLCLGVVGFAASPTAARDALFASISPDDAAQVVWDQIMAARADAGLAPLALDDDTSALARARSIDMAAHGYFGHYDAAGRSFADLMPAFDLRGPLASETLQRNNYPDSAGVAARGLLASPAHRAILFDPRYRVGGVGHAVAGDGMHYFTLIVIQP